MCNNCDNKQENMPTYHACDEQSINKLDILEHHATVKEEIYCHLPFAIFSVALAMLVLSFLSFGPSSGNGCHGCHHDSLSYRLFHNFHFLHLLFAGTGAMLMFKKYSKKTGLGVIVSFFVAAVFCTLSDALLPFLGGKVFNLNMHFHWCFISHLDTVLPFLFVGIFNGWIMSKHAVSKQFFYSTGFHFFHIFISSMASLLYLVSFGFHDWWVRMGIVFVYMILVVLIPCTLADIVVPMLFAKSRGRKKNSKK